MSNIIFSWPANLAPAEQLQQQQPQQQLRHISGAAKSAAHAFLSQLDWEEKHSPELGEAHHHTSFPPSQTSLIRMREERRAPHSRDVNLARFKQIANVNEKPQRIFLSWDRSYPLMVFSLVSDPRHGAKKPAVEMEGKLRNMLKVPKDESLPAATTNANAMEEDDSADEESGGADAGDYSDSSSDDEASPHHHAANTRSSSTSHRKAISYKFLLNAPSKADAGSAETNLDEDYNSPQIEPGSPPAASLLHAANLQLALGAQTDDATLAAAPPPPPPQASSLARTLQQRAAWDLQYSHEILDDSKIIQGKHRTVQNLSAMRTSIIPYIKTKVLKEELNTLFRKQNPNLPEDLTLSKVRKLKRTMLQLCMNSDHELSSLALAYVYLEKLILKRVVHKANRKLVAFTCLVIAIKFNETGFALRRDSALVEEMEAQHKISLQEINKTEFAVFAHLHFNLHLPGSDYVEHFVRLLKTVDVSASEYLKVSPERSKQILSELSHQVPISRWESETQDTSSSSSSSSSENEE